LGYQKTVQYRPGTPGLQLTSPQSDNLKTVDGVIFHYIKPVAFPTQINPVGLDTTVDWSKTKIKLRPREVVPLASES